MNSFKDLVGPSIHVNVQANLLNVLFFLNENFAGERENFSFTLTHHPLPQREFHQSRVPSGYNFEYLFMSNMEREGWADNLEPRISTPKNSRDDDLK